MSQKGEASKTRASQTPPKWIKLVDSCFVTKVTESVQGPHGASIWTYVDNVAS